MTELFYTLGCIFFTTTISAQLCLIYGWYQFFKVDISIFDKSSGTDREDI